MGLIPGSLSIFPTGNPRAFLETWMIQVLTPATSPVFPLLQLVLAAPWLGMEERTGASHPQTACRPGREPRWAEFQGSWRARWLPSSRGVGAFALFMTRSLGLAAGQVEALGSPRKIISFA